jgi:5-hydroxyisourate hydrolase
MGRPAPKIGVRLDIEETPGISRILTERVTDSDGRVKDLIPAGELREGRYRLTFATAAYFELNGAVAFFPEVTVCFDVRDTSKPVHVPLLLSPFGYSTYRGS